MGKVEVGEIGTERKEVRIVSSMKLRTGRPEEGIWGVSVAERTVGFEPSPPPKWFS